MPRDVLTATKLSSAGVAPPAEVDGDPVDNHQFQNSGKTFLVVRNNGASAHTVTLVTPGAIEGLALADRQISVPAGETRYIGPFSPGTYNNPNSSTVFLDADSADLKLSLLEL